MVKKNLSVLSFLEFVFLKLGMEVEFYHLMFYIYTEILLFLILNYFFYIY